MLLERRRHRVEPVRIGDEVLERQRGDNLFDPERQHRDPVADRSFDLAANVGRLVRSAREDKDGQPAAVDGLDDRPGVVATGEHIAWRNPAPDLVLLEGRADRVRDRPVLGRMTDEDVVGHAAHHSAKPGAGRTRVRGGRSGSPHLADSRSLELITSATPSVRARSAPDERAPRDVERGVCSLGAGIGPRHAPLRPRHWIGWRGRGTRVAGGSVRHDHHMGDSHIGRRIRVDQDPGTLQATAPAAFSVTIWSSASWRNGWPAAMPLVPPSKSSVSELPPGSVAAQASSLRAPWP